MADDKSKAAKDKEEMASLKKSLPQMCNAIGPRFVDKITANGTYKKSRR